MNEYEDALVEEFIRSTLRRTPGGGLVWKFDPALREIDDLGTLRDVDLSVAVGRIACPTLVVRGEHSDVLGRDAARRLSGRVHAASLVEAKGVAPRPLPGGGGRAAGAGVVPAVDRPGGPGRGVLGGVRGRVVVR